MVAAVISVVGAILIAMTGALWKTVSTHLDRLNTSQDDMKDSLNQAINQHGERITRLEGAVWPRDTGWARRRDDGPDYHDYPTIGGK